MLTGFGATSFTICAISPGLLTPGAYKQSAPASAYAASRSRAVCNGLGSRTSHASQRPVSTTPVFEASIVARAAWMRKISFREVEIKEGTAGSRALRDALSSVDQAVATLCLALLFGFWSEPSGRPESNVGLVTACWPLQSGRSLHTLCLARLSEVGSRRGAGNSVLATCV